MYCPRTGSRISSRRGIAAVYFLIALFVLFGMVALAVDMGRAQTTRTSLQGAADAAARAAAMQLQGLNAAHLDSAVNAVNDRAVNTAAANVAAGDSVQLDPSQDIELGIWRRDTHTFELLSGAARVSANAVHVTAVRNTARGNALQLFFGPLIGRSTINVRAQAIAMLRGYRGPIGVGLIGIDWIQLNGTTMTDGYNAATTNYNPGHADNTGSIATNGTITGKGTVDIKGDAFPGPSPGDKVDLVGNSEVTGYQKPLDEEMHFDPVSTPTTYNNAPLQTLLDSKGKPVFDNQRNLSIKSNAAVVIPGGTEANPNIYYINNLSITGNGDITFTGPVIMYVSGNVDITGNGSVNETHVPAYLQVNVVGSGTVDIGGGSELYAHVYAPQSPVTVHGTGGSSGFFGTIVGKSLDVKGNSALHYDESGLPGLNGKFHVQLVK